MCWDCRLFSGCRCTQSSYVHKRAALHNRMNLFPPLGDGLVISPRRIRGKRLIGRRYAKTGGQMRRAIAATVMGGLLLGGAVATPSVAAARGGGKAPSKARAAAPAKPRVGSAAAHSKAVPGKAVLSKTVRKAVTDEAATNK